jgi:hypothetical protein
MLAVLPELRADYGLAACLQRAEARHLAALHSTQSCVLRRERYDAADHERAAKHKATANCAFARAAASAEDGCVLVLDAASGHTSRALLEAGVPAHRILVPNPHPHVVCALRRELGVSAFASTLEEFLEESDVPLAAAYMDHTCSLRTDVLQTLSRLAQRCSVVAATFSCRNPSAGTWSRAHAVSACISVLKRQAAERGLQLAGCGADGLADYQLGDMPHRLRTTLSCALAARDLGGVCELLASWAASPASEQVPRLRASAAAVAAAAAPSLVAGVIGAVWLTGSLAPLAVLGRGPAAALDDAAAGALMRVASAVVAYSRVGSGPCVSLPHVDSHQPDRLGLRWNRAEDASSILHNSVLLYPGQMAFVLLRLMQPAIPLSTVTNID